MNTEMPGGGMPPQEGGGVSGPPPGGPPPGQGMPGAPMPGAPMPGAPGGGMGGMQGPGMPGGPGGPGMTPYQEKASGMAIAALIVSVSGLLCWITSLVGFILGMIELGRIKNGQSSPKGKGLAKAAVIIGAVLFALGLIFIIISIATGGFSFEVEA